MLAHRCAGATWIVRQVVEERTVLRVHHARNGPDCDAQHLGHRQAALNVRHPALKSPLTSALEAICLVCALEFLESCAAQRSRRILRYRSQRAVGEEKGTQLMKRTVLVGGVCILLIGVGSAVASSSAQAVCPGPYVNTNLSSTHSTVAQPGGTCTNGHATRAKKVFYTSDNNGYTAVAYGTWERMQFPLSVANLPYGHHKNHEYQVNY